MSKEYGFHPEKVAYNCKDAYSFDFWGLKEWNKAAYMLADRGYNSEQIEGILRSKLTRWCRDNYTEDGYGTSSSLEAFIDDPRNKVDEDYVNSLI